MKLVLVVLAALLVATVVFAEPPPGIDPNSSTARWFRSLKSESGMDCCGLGDCRAVRSNVVDGHWVVWIRPDDGDAVRVPDDIVQHRDDNPTGHSILCASPVQPETIMYCFIPMSGA